MERTTNQKGAIAEAYITAALIERGYDVYRPAAEGGRYDLVADVAGRLLRIQAKWARSKGDVLIVSGETCRRGPGGDYVKKTYDASEIDAVLAFSLEHRKTYVFPISMMAGRRNVQLRLTPPKNNQRLGIHLAEMFELDTVDLARLEAHPGAIAQLGERVHGMHEVVGSSPTSSTSKAA